MVPEERRLVGIEQGGAVEDDVAQPEPVRRGIAQPAHRPDHFGTHRLGLDGPCGGSAEKRTCDPCGSAKAPESTTPHAGAYSTAPPPRGKPAVGIAKRLDN